MSYQLPPLNWLRSFEAAARKTSFTAAGDELGLTPAAVSYQVRSLEEHLGFPLFVRLPRSLRLTDMGSAYLPSVRKAFGDLSASTIGLFGARGEMNVTIKAPISFATQWLAPRLKSFVDDYPKIDIRLYTSNWVGLDVGEKVDVDIRYGDGNWDGEHAEQIFSEGVIAACSPEYLLENGPVENLEDLSKKKLIHVMGVEDSWERLFSLNNIDFDDSGNKMKVDSSLSAMQLASAGVGITLVFDSFAEEYLRLGKLVSALDFDHRTNQAHYLILPEARTRPRPEVLLFRDWLLALAKQ